MAKHKRVLVLSAGRGVGWSHMMQLVDTEFAELGGSVLRSTMTRSNENVVNYAAEHYQKVNESYKNVVDHCNWCSCSGAWVCHGCLRKIKHFASIEDKKRPVLAPKARRKSLPEENS